MEDQSPMSAISKVDDRSWLSWPTRWNLFVKTRFPTLAQAVTVVIGLAAVLISLATLFVVERQAWIYDEQRKMMAEQMPITVKAERAYLGVASLDADFKSGKVIVLLQNVGHLPATQIKVRLLAMRHKADGSSLGTLEPRSYESEEVSGALKMRLSLPLDQFQHSEADDIRAQKEILYITVSIQYNDGFATAVTASRFQFDGPTSDNWSTLPTEVP
jgi:hypothetical protein